MLDCRTWLIKVAVKGRDVRVKGVHLVQAVGLPGRARTMTLWKSLPVGQNEQDNGMTSQ